MTDTGVESGVCVMSHQSFVIGASSKRTGRGWASLQMLSRYDCSVSQILVHGVEKEQQVRRHIRTGSCVFIGLSGGDRCPH